MMVCTSTNVFGAEMMSLNIMNALKNAGHDVFAVTSSWSDGEFGKRLARIGIQSTAVPLGTLSKKISPQALWWTGNAVVRAPKLWALFRRAVRAFAPDILLLTSPKQGLWLYPWLQRQPSFLIEHSLKVVGRANQWLYRTIGRKLAGFVAVSRFMAKHLQQLGVAGHQIRVIYNCVRTAEVRVAQARFNRTGVTIGIVGQIAPHKGHDVLLEASSLLRARGAQFRIAVFGRGEEGYVTTLKAQATRSGVAALWNWCGYSGYRDEVYDNIDILAVPSVFEEPFGMVAIEAMARGLPVVASAHGGLPEIVEDGTTGLLVTPNDPSDLAAKLASLVTDPLRAQQLGGAGRRRVVTSFSEGRMVEAFDGLFAGYGAS